MRPNRGSLEHRASGKELHKFYALSLKLSQQVYEKDKGYLLS
jgi:hypothetical protein